MITPKKHCATNKNKNSKPGGYSGDISAGSLLITESRKIVELLLKQVNDDAWHKAIVIDNILQKRSPVAAKRQARLIKNRLILILQTTVF